MSSMRGVTGAVALVLGASFALAQEPYAIESQLRYEVWDGSNWTNRVVARPGSRVEVRAVVSYTGSNPNVRGLGEVLYQPIFSNWDNEGPSQDNIGAWRNGGVGGQSPVGSSPRQGMLTTAEGESGEALTSYGRVGFGAISTNFANQNTLASFRHVDGSFNAPQGSWLRIAGFWVQAWPAMIDGPLTSDLGNRVLRGVSSAQWSEILPGGNGSNPDWRSQTVDIVVFRQAVLLSDSTMSRTIEISSDHASLDRENWSIGSQNDTRVMQWHVSSTATTFGSLRTGVAIDSAEIIIAPNIPSPGAIALLGLGAIAVRRRRTVK